MLNFATLIAPFGLPAPIVEAKPKVRIRAYSPQYYQWLGAAKPQPVVVPQPAVEMYKKIMPDDADHECGMCGGEGSILIRKTGRYVSCARCMGKGFLVEADMKRHAAYLKRKEEGRPMNVTYKNHYVA